MYLYFSLNDLGHLKSFLYFAIALQFLLEDRMMYQLGIEPITCN